MRLTSRTRHDRTHAHTRAYVGPFDRVCHGLGCARRTRNHSLGGRGNYTTRALSVGFRGTKQGCAAEPGRRAGGQAEPGLRRCRARFGHHGRCRARFGRSEPPRWQIIARKRIECPNVARRRRQCPYVARRQAERLECARKRHGATRSHQTRANARASTRAAPACSKLARAARSVAPVVMTSSSKRRRLPATGSTTSYKPRACF